MYHQQKLASTLMALAADFLHREAGKQALMTVTNIKISLNLREATIFFTVFPQSFEKQALLFAKRKRSEFRKCVMDHTALRATPSVDFALDLGEKRRLQLDEALRTAK